jgi:DNA-binding NarL/FixJ family response regulator
VEPVRLLVVEDSATLAEALLFAFSFEKDIESVGVAPSIGQAVDMLMAEEPEVVLMDVRLPDGSGLDGAARIMALRPGTAVIVMTAHADNLLALEAAENGAAGFLLKDVRIAKIVAGVRRAVTGGLAVEPAVLEALLAQAMTEGRSGRATTAGALDLSPPEEEVLRLLADGLDGADIAERLGLADTEVARIAASTRARLGARSNLEAVVRAARAGLFGPDHGSRARISNR